MHINVGYIVASVTCRIISYLFVIFFIWEEFKELLRDGYVSYFQNQWNYIDMGNYGLFLIQMYYFFHFINFQESIGREMNKPNNSDFLDIPYLAGLYQMVDWASCTNVFFMFLKLFEYLVSSKNIARIFNTITNAIRRIAPLIVVIIIMNMMFALTFFVGFNHVDKNLRSLTQSFRMYIVSVPILSTHASISLQLHCNVAFQLTYMHTNIYI
jgi:hypothetical protein